MSVAMHKGRMEAFSDGVIAIIITIMVLELKVPHGADLDSLAPLLPVFVSYVLSFVYVAIYWNNHHHLLQAVKHVNGPILWANVNLLFWLSLFPFATAWMGENHFAMLPVAMYGVVLLAAALAYTVLVRTLLRHHEPGSTLHQAIGRDDKGNASLGLYLLGIALAFWQPGLAVAVFGGVALMWLVPDRRIEQALAD